MDGVGSTSIKHENDPPQISTLKILQEDDPKGFDNAAFSGEGVASHNKSTTDKQGSDKHHTESTTVRKSTRKKIPSVKGKESLLKDAIVSMKGSHGVLKKQMDVLVSLLNDSNVEQVVNMLNTIDEVYAEFTESYTRACEIFEIIEGDEFKKEHQEVHNLMEDTGSIFLDCKKKGCGWIMEKGTEYKSWSLESPKNESNSSQSSQSTNKSKTFKQLGDSRSAELSLRQKAKLAGLKAEADAVKKMREAELAAELSRIQVKIKKAEAMVKIYSAYGSERKENNEVDDKVDDRTMWMDHADVKDDDKFYENTVFAPQTDSLKRTSQQQNFMIEMDELQPQPNTDLNIFTGNPLEYQYFKAKFQDVLDTAVENQQDRLTILLHYTQGEARDLIKHLETQDREDCYTKAMKLLDDEYGSRHLHIVDSDETPAADDEEAAVNEYRRQLYDEFKNNITLHGYRQLSTEKGWRKLFWVFLMTLLTVFAVYLSYHMLRDFGYRTALEYEYEEELSHLDFPTITICGEYPVYSPMSFKKFPLNISLEEFKTFYKDMLHKYSYLGTPSNTSKAILQDLYAINITSYKGILKLFENSFEDSMTNSQVNMCFQGGRSCNPTTDFRETLTMWGQTLCHQWNYYDEKKASKQQKITREQQSMTGLFMSLDIYEDHRLLDASTESWQLERSIALYIHPYGTPHYLTKHTELIGLQTGKINFINIELAERNLLQSPYSTNCGTKELSIIKNFPYTRAICEIDCILAKTYEKCKCVGFEYEGYIGDMPICSVKQMKCYYKSIEKYRGSCVQYASTCPRECTYNQYHIHTSLGDVRDEAVDNLQKFYLTTMGWTKNLDEAKKYVKRNILGFRIGYKSLSKKVENYVPLVTPSGLIGTLGGSIGLCLGFSFVTAFEVVVFIYDYAIAQ